MINKYQDMFANSASREELLDCGLQSPLSTAQKTSRNHYAFPPQIWLNDHVYLCLVILWVALKMSEETSFPYNLGWF